MTKITQDDIECWKAIFSLTNEQMDVEGDDKRGLELLAAHREAAINSEAQNPWKAAIIGELVNCFLLTDEHVNDPKKAIRDAIAWNQKIALDPAVSKDAADLVEAGREQAEREVVDHARKAAQIHHRIAAETPRGDEMRVHSLSLSRAYGAVADAIENREHRNDTD